MTPAGQATFLEKHQCLASFLPCKHVLLAQEAPQPHRPVQMAEVGEGKGGKGKGLGGSGEEAS